jgi:hypothetical protein
MKVKMHGFVATGPPRVVADEVYKPVHSFNCNVSGSRNLGQTEAPAKLTSNVKAVLLAWTEALVY